MPRRARNLLGEILCHHIVQGINKEYIFQENEEKKKYLNLLKKYYKKQKVDIIAYCIMDNHAHFLLYADSIQNISKFMQQVNSQYAMYYNKKHERVGYVYRNRFKSVPIMRREQLYTCIKYIHMNPVKARMVKEEKDYQYPSYNDYINQNGFLNQKILSFVFNSNDNYIEKFKAIEYEELNLENEPANFEKALKDFLIKEKKNLKEIQKSKNLIKKFMVYLTSKNYKFTKKEVVEVLKMSNSTFYRRLYG